MFFNFKCSRCGAEWEADSERDTWLSFDFIEVGGVHMPNQIHRETFCEACRNSYVRWYYINKKYDTRVDDCVARDDVLEMACTSEDKEEIIAKIKELPTVTYKKDNTKFLQFDDGRFMCKMCRFITPTKTRYCANCGAFVTSDEEGD